MCAELSCVHCCVFGLVVWKPASRVLCYRYYNYYVQSSVDIQIGTEQNMARKWR